MEVAIMGAGMAGLSCAITLEKYGVTPVIFEKRSCPGDRFVNGESLFSILNRPVRDSLPYLEKEYQITLKPISAVNRLVIHAKHKTGSIDGDIGYTNIRGRHRDSFENQLANQVKTPIRYHSTMTYEALAKDFDRVVLATGDGEYASQLNNYRCDLTCSIKGAAVEGEFEVDTPHVWFHREILPQGYGWLIPYSQNEANLVFVCPDYPESMNTDIDHRWDLFYNLAMDDLDRNLKITDRFQVRKYMLGRCGQSKVDNTYFTGNCFGALSPGLGFGQFTSVLTGVYAALDICGRGDYEQLTKPLFENYENSLTVRRYLESLDDQDFDHLVGSTNIKLVDSLVTKIFSKESGFDLLKWASPFLPR